MINEDWFKVMVGAWLMKFTRWSMVKNVGMMVNNMGKYDSLCDGDQWLVMDDGGE